MKIIHKIEPWLTNSGKKAITFTCEHCGTWCYQLDSYFYATNLNKVDLEEALNTFAESINSKTITDFLPPKTAKKLQLTLCNCIENVVDIETAKARQRAKIILEKGLAILGQ
ncbi:MAG: hypothetical protein WCP79_14055 [Bacillota bacterium]